MKRNIALLGLVVVLGVLVFLLPSKNNDKTNDKPEEKFQLMSIREPELKKLTLFKNKKSLAIEKKEKGYLLLPSKFEGGNSEIMNLISEINSLEGYPIVLQQQTEGETVIEADTQSGKLFLKVMGKREMGKPAYYVKNNQKTFIIETEKLDKILNTAEDELRNHILTDFTSKDISEFTIDKKRFFQKEEGRWLVDGLMPEETDSNKVFTVFATVSTLRIKNFTHSLNKAQYGLINPMHTLVLKFKAGGAKKYFFSQLKNSFYCLPENGKEIFEVNDFDWKYFEKDINSLKKDKQQNQPILPNIDSQEDESEEENES